MQKCENIVRYSAEELRELRNRGESQTDWARFDAMTEEELEAAIASDPEEPKEWEYDWSSLRVAIPGPKEQLTLRLDRDIVDWFKGAGKGYQTRINAVLKSYVQAQKP